MRKPSKLPSKLSRLRGPSSLLLAHREIVDLPNYEDNIAMEPPPKGSARLQPSHGLAETVAGGDAMDDSALRTLHQSLKRVMSDDLGLMSEICKALGVPRPAGESHATACSQAAAACVHSYKSRLVNGAPDEGRLEETLHASLQRVLSAPLDIDDIRKTIRSYPAAGAATPLTASATCTAPSKPAKAARNTRPACCKTPPCVESDPCDIATEFTVLKFSNDRKRSLSARKSGAHTEQNQRSTQKMPRRDTTSGRKETHKNSVRRNIGIGPNAPAAGA
jgi:hypothetical protein